MDRCTLPTLFDKKNTNLQFSLFLKRHLFGNVQSEEDKTEHDEKREVALQDKDKQVIGVGWIREHSHRNINIREVSRRVQHTDNTSV